MRPQVQRVTIAPHQKLPLGHMILDLNEGRELASLFTRRYLTEQLRLVLAGAPLSSPRRVTRPTAACVQQMANFTRLTAACVQNPFLAGSGFGGAQCAQLCLCCNLSHLAVQGDVCPATGVSLRRPIRRVVAHLHRGVSPPPARSLTPKL